MSEKQEKVLGINVTDDSLLRDAKKDFEEIKSKIPEKYDVHLENWGDCYVTVLSKKTPIDGQDYYSLIGTYLVPNWALIEVERREKIIDLLNKSLLLSDDENYKEEVDSVLKDLNCD